MEVTKPIKNRVPTAWQNPTGELHEKIRRATSTPMLILSLAFTVILIIPLAHPKLSTGARTTLDTIDYSLWAAYAVEYFALLSTAPEKRKYFLHHIPDFLMVFLPMLRPLRAFRAGRLLVAAAATTEHSRERLLSKAPLYAAFMASLVLLCSSVMVLGVEKDAPHATIKTFGEAVWWSITTLTTTGYGDYYPVTAGGRVIAAALMLTGLSLLGITTASVASWFVKLTDQEEEVEMKRVLAIMERLEERLDKMEQSEAQVLAEAEEALEEAEAPKQSPQPHGSQFGDI